MHAIALCDGLEAAMGALVEATIPGDRRWIPKGMEVSYTAKADGSVVIEGLIQLWATEKPARRTALPG